MKSRRGLYGFAIALAAVGFASAWAVRVHAQTDPRVTGAAVVTRIEQARQALAALPAAQPGHVLAPTVGQLDELANALRAALGTDAVKPLERIGGDTRARALAAYAAANRARAYVKATKGCIAGQAQAAGQALAASVKRLAATASSAQSGQPMIEGIETLDNRPIFAIRGQSRPVKLALVGSNLSDARCDNLPLSATDGSDQLPAAQPKITALLPNRIEVEFPADLQPGDYVLHVIPQRKRFLFGCAAKPEATTVLRVIPAVKVAVDYALTARCRTAAANPAKSTGTLPVITAYGQTVSRQVTPPACDDPVGYSLTATAKFTQGKPIAIGPISQAAAVGITAGWPGGLRIHWDPSVRTIFLSLAPNACTAVY